MTLENEREKARVKTIDSLSRYKFQMFGYWAAIWVHLNSLCKIRLSNPFKDCVHMARDAKEVQP